MRVLMCANNDVYDCRCELQQIAIAAFFLCTDVCVLLLLLPLLPLQLHLCCS